jgi:predicted O-methyltransferase YrrM
MRTFQSLMGLLRVFVGQTRDAMDRIAGHGELPTQVRRYQMTYDRFTGGYIQGKRGEVDYGSIELEVGELYRAMVWLLKPQRVLETGTYNGYSTCCIAAALRDIGPDTSVITVDPDPKPHLWERTELEKHIRWLEMYSQDAAAQLKAHSFDMLVLDSDHHYDTIIFELMTFEPLLAIGGTILLHDSLFFDGVGAAVAQLRDNPRFECVTLDTPRTHGLPAMRRPGVTIVRKIANGEPALKFEPEHAGKFVGKTETTGADGWPLLRKLEQERLAEYEYQQGQGASR